MAANPTYTAASAPAYPRLVADIGGTHARFACVAAPNEPPSDVMVLSSEDFVQIKDAALHYLNTLISRPRQACMGIAAPLLGDQVRMTNQAWSFSARSLKESLGLERLLLVNDFTALALGVPSLQPAQLAQVGGGIERFGPKAILGPGTGLGASALVPCGDRTIAVPGEGGHVTLAASTAEEAAVIACLWEEWSHVSAERLLCGSGLVLLHRALAAVRGIQTQDYTGSDITSNALQGRDEHCRDTVNMFCAMLGTLASNLALTLGAVGGVYIGGGIVPSLGEYFHRSPFRQRFESKGRYRDYLADIPSYVIHAPAVALAGAALALDLPHVLGSVEA